MNRASRQAFLRSIPITLPDSWAFSGDGFRVNEQLTSYAVESNQTFLGMRFWESDRSDTVPIKSRWSSRNAFANLPPQSHPPLAAWVTKQERLGVRAVAVVLE